MKTEILQKIAEGILMLSIIGAVLYGVYHFFGLWITIGYAVSMAVITAFIAVDITLIPQHYSLTLFISA